MKGIKIDMKMLIGIVVSMAIILCVIITISSAVSSVKQKKNATEVDNYLSTDFVKNTDSSSEQPDTDSVTSAIENAEFDTASEEKSLSPADCNSDFWQVKLGIAECYDHIFRKGHMRGDTAYYSGSCDNHDASQIQELAKKVKLYRETNEDGSFSYSATLPEIGWAIILYDDSINKIIDAQISGTPEVISEDISIVMYYYDNSLQIEIAQ